MAGNQVKWWRSIATGSTTNWDWLSSTRMDSLANGSVLKMGTLANHTNYDMMAMLHINVHMASNMPSGGEFDFFAVPIGVVNASAYSPQVYTDHLLATRGTRTGSSTQYITIDPFSIGPVSYDIYIRNRSGVAGISSTDVWFNRMAYMTINPEIQAAS